MADLNLHRDHTLGLARARKVALKWAEDVEKKLEMECTLIEGDDSDVLEFTRSGVEGRMIVAATYFDLEARLPRHHRGRGRQAARRGIGEGSGEGSQDRQGCREEEVSYFRSSIRST
jgi:hypothetical protein